MPDIRSMIAQAAAPAHDRIANEQMAPRGLLLEMVRSGDLPVEAALELQKALYAERDQQESDASYDAAQGLLAKHVAEQRRQQQETQANAAIDQHFARQDGLNRKIRARGSAMSHVPEGAVPAIVAATPGLHEDWKKWKAAKDAADAATGRGSLIGAAKQFYLGQTEPDKYAGKQFLSDAGMTELGLSAAPFLPVLPTLLSAGSGVGAMLGQAALEALPTLMGSQDLGDAAFNTAIAGGGQMGINRLLSKLGVKPTYNRLDQFLGAGKPRVPLTRSVVTAELASDMPGAPLANKLLSNPSTQFPESLPTEVLPADNWPGLVAQSNRKMATILDRIQRENGAHGVRGTDYPMQGAWRGETTDLAPATTPRGRRRATSVGYDAYNPGHFIEFPTTFDAAMAAPKIGDAGWQEGVGWGEVTRAPTARDFITSPLKAWRAMQGNALEAATPGYGDVVRLGQEIGLGPHLVVHDGRGRTFVKPWDDSPTVMSELRRKLEALGFNPRSADLDTDYLATGRL